MRLRSREQGNFESTKRSTESSLQNMMEIKFINKPENEKISRTAAAVFAAVTDPTLEELSDFKTAVSEAVTNAIIHAYPDAPGDIEMILQREGRQITVIVKDYGVGIENVAKSMEPLYTTFPSGERSGMGFTFMEAFSDHLEVDSIPGQGTTVKLVKTMGKGEESGADL